MNLKEIIIEELRHTLNLYKSRDNSEISIDIAFELEPMIKGIANNIISKMDWQIISSGEVKNIVYQTGQVVITFNKLPEQLSAGNIICGKTIEIAVRVKDKPNE